MHAATLPPRHLLLALVIVVVWGTNFVVAKQAMATLPPLTFAALRFALAFLPAALFVARPAVPWRLLAGYGAWAWLLARYPAATVAPMALLVPVVGLASSAVVLGEALPAWKLGAAALVIGGLALNLLVPRLIAARAPTSAAAASFARPAVPPARPTPRSSRPAPRR
jgi:O-acetylserine/cysteine efflux transporter